MSSHLEAIIHHTFICAVYNGNLEEVRKLIDKYDLPFSPALLRGYGLLCHALRFGHTAIAKLLLNSGCDVNSNNKDISATPLHYVASMDEIEIIQMILDKGGNINAKNGCGQTPLHIATVKGQETVVNLLLSHGADIDILNYAGETALYKAVEFEFLNIVEIILQFGPNLNSKSNKACVKIALKPLKRSNYNILEALLEYGFVIDPDYKFNAELLHNAAREGNFKIVESFLKFRANYNKFDNFMDGFTLLHTATIHQKEKIVKLLLYSNADVNVKDRAGKPPIFYAIENADFSIAKLLITHKSDARDKLNTMNFDVQKSRTIKCPLYFQRGVDINCRFECGNTLLHYTALNEEPFSGTCSDRLEIAKLLLSQGAAVDAKTDTGKTTLHFAIEYGLVKFVAVLLEYNADVDSCVRSNIRPLHISANSGIGEITKMLLNKGASINVKQNAGSTPLHIASAICHVSVIKELLTYSADIESDFKNCCKCSADVDSKDFKDRTPLHIASQEGYEEVVTWLLDYGSDINSKCVNGQTPLDYAFSRSRLVNSDSILFPQAPFSDTLLVLLGEYDNTIDILKRHILKLKAAELYVSTKNLMSIGNSAETNKFTIQCEQEIANIKCEMITHNISYYNILTKNINSVARYINNEYIMEVLKSDVHKSKFPIYASMIDNQFRRAKERKQLMEHAHTAFHLLSSHLPVMPYDCVVKVFSYLSVNDLRNIICTRKEFGSLIKPVFKDFYCFPYYTEIFCYCD